MSAFDPESDLGHDLAFRLLRDSAVTLFHREDVLVQTTEWLSEHGYQIVSLDASSWASGKDLHREIARALDFPDYYGHNLDALNDCLRDVVTQDYGWEPAATGLVVVFRGYDHFVRKMPAAAQTVLDIIAVRSRSAALLGRRLICLVQTDDHDIAFPAVGATPVAWNDAEW